jgi:hypothetical protein
MPSQCAHGELSHFWVISLVLLKLVGLGLYFIDFVFLFVRDAMEVYVLCMAKRVLEGSGEV